MNDMMTNAIDELYRRAEVANARPESEYGDLPPIRQFKMQVGNEKGKYNFSMFLMTHGSPALGKDGVLFRTRYQHYKMPVGGNDVITRTCLPMSMADGSIRCPFCEVVKAELEQVKIKEKRQNIYQYQAKGYAFVNVLPVSILGRTPEWSQYEGDGKMPYLPHVTKLSERLADKIAVYLHNQNALMNADINPLNPQNAAPLIVTVERHGPRPMDVRYDCSFGMQRSAWASNAEQIQYLYDNAYDLAAIFKYPDEEEYRQQWEEASKVAEELQRRRDGLYANASGSYDAPGFRPPQATAGSTGYANVPVAGGTLNVPQFTRPAAAAPVFQPPTTAAPSVAPAVSTPTLAAPPTTSFQPPTIPSAAAKPPSTGSPAAPMASSPTAASFTPSSRPAGPPPLPTYGAPAGAPRVAGPGAPAVAPPTTSFPQG